MPDVVQLQTTQDFIRWKEAGVLRLYKPSGFSKVHPGFKDPDGAWLAIAVYAFSYMYDDALGDQAPASPLELVDPRWKDAIASAYPHDDDAVLYLFRQYALTYGWTWVSQFAAQNPRNPQPDRGGRQQAETGWRRRGRLADRSAGSWRAVGGARWPSVHGVGPACGDP